MEISKTNKYSPNTKRRQWEIREKEEEEENKNGHKLSKFEMKKKIRREQEEEGNDCRPTREKKK